MTDNDLLQNDVESLIEGHSNVSWTARTVLQLVRKDTIDNVKGILLAMEAAIPAVTNTREDYVARKAKRTLLDRINEELKALSFEKAAPIRFAFGQRVERLHVGGSVADPNYNEEGHVGVFWDDIQEFEYVDPAELEVLS